MKELNMSEAKKLCIWHDFETKEEERAFMRGFESALEWINDEKALGWSDKLEKELEKLRQ